MSIAGISVVFYFYMLLHFNSAEIKKEVEENPYTKGYFSFPLSPGSQASLSGSFGDIRINHFHAGLDIRTGGREGKSVYSAADGYISRINVSQGGYGNALYITHPNGLTSVYGHLKEYAAPIKKRLLQEQYKAKSFEINFILDPEDLPVKKGELVAVSGNTGGSGGPHLHFEIRDEKERTLDPALFGFKEIDDNVAPVVEFISLKCLSADARVNGQFGTFDFPVSRTTGSYFINQDIKVWGDIGLELYTYDKSQTSPFRLGIKYLEVRKDNQPTFIFELDKLSFHNKIDMNLHTNYVRMVQENKKLHKGYFEEGNDLGFYKFNEKKGYMSFRDNQEHQVSVILKDTYENVQSFTFSLSSSLKNTPAIPTVLRGSEIRKEEVLDTFFKLVRKKSEKKLRLLDGNFATEILPSYSNSMEETFIVDLKENFFSSYIDGNSTYPSPFTDEVSTNFNKVSKKAFEIDFKNVLYHPIYVNLKSDKGELHLDRDIYPMKDKFQTKWLVKLQNINVDKDAAYLTSGRKPQFIAGSWKQNTITFYPKEFGTYSILRDETKPDIRVRTITSDKLQFTIGDNLSGIKSFECKVDDQWVLMEYEYKNGMLWSEKKDSTPFSGEVILIVTDNCDNEAIYKTTL